MENKFICAACGKELTKKNKMSCYGNIYCPKHYQQMLKHGHVLDNIQRTMRDYNDYEFVDKNTVKIITYNVKCIRTGAFLIDMDDFERVIVKKWRIWQDRAFTGSYAPITIHVFIIGKENIPEGMVVDHINHNPYDNRKNNLRVITQHQNTMNRSLLSKNKSNYCGVWYDVNRDKWAAEIKYNDTKCYLGRYSDINSAVYVRYIAEKELFKEYRNKSNDKNILNSIKKCDSDTKNKLYKYTKSKLYKKYGNISR